ncbi:hypothetical protein [uncultured Bacteroides sp.]|uniref:hypothetical protein n=1 Tax=uncultured Bacteroides sp. TaxID=162156 RepID=UPI0025A9AE9A|nr:hypothetical protein [uncultured Bacteroides sp.]
MKQLLYLSLFLLFCLLAARCVDETATRRLAMLDAAERLLPTNADSASLLLAGIPHPEELSNRDFARYCMLCGRSTNYTHADTLSVYQWKRAQKWIDKHGSPEERAQVGLFLGRAYAEDGEWDLAMQTYAEALHYAKEYKVYNVAGYICTYMADLYREYDAPEKIIMKYAEATSFFKKAKNLKSQAYAMKNLATQYAFVDSFSHAKSIMKQVDSIAGLLNIQRLNYNIANAYANIYNLQKRYDLAEEYYKKAIMLNSHQEVRDSIGLAHVYMASGKYDSAKELVDKIFPNDSMDFVLNHIYANFYKAKRDYQKAFHFEEVCLNILDSMFIHQSKTQVLEIEKKYNHLKVQEENGRLRNARQRSFIYLIICVSFLIIGSVIFYFYQKHAQMQLRWQEEKLNSLDKERSKIASQLFEARHSLKNMLENQEENLRLQQKILFLSEKYKELQKQRLENSAIYKKLSSLLVKPQPNNNKPLLTDKLWNMLVIELSRIYPGFRSSLYEQCSNLSEEEYRYCYLHVLGFDGNNEAVLLNINPSSVWMKRSRIKQKLDKDFPKDQSLHDILVNIFLN